jgi:hypothetical protein
MLAYLYDNITKEFLYSFEAQSNPKMLGEYLIPESCTFKPIPSFLKDTIPCFEGDKWVIKSDFRGQTQIDLKTKELSIVSYIGDVLSGYQLITKEIEDDFVANPDKYDVVNGVFQDITDTEEYKKKKELEEKERVARLNMTKLDFATYLEEYGVSYSQLKAALAGNDNAQKQWDLCERVYRFNPLLDEMAKGFGITSKQLDTMFKKANGEV